MEECPRTTMSAVRVGSLPVGDADLWRRPMSLSAGRDLHQEKKYHCYRPLYKVVSNI